MITNLLDSNDKVVLLNGKIVKTALLVDEQEGWVEIPDIATMAPLDIQACFEMGEDDQVEAQELKTKRLYGKVEVKTIKPR